MANNFAGDSDCVALWKFDDPTATVTTPDDIGGNDLTKDGSGWVADTTNKMEGAGSYPSQSATRAYRTDSDLDAGFPLKDGDTAKLISVCCWVRETTQGTNSQIWGKSSWWSGTDSLSIHSDSGSLKVQWSASEWFTTGFSLVDEEWYHIGVVADGVSKTLKVRVYRASDASVSNYTVSPTGEISVGANPWSVGHWDAGTGPFTGNIDEVVVFKRLLADDEIDEIRSGTFGTVYDDGTPSGGIVFGGEVVEVGVSSYTDPAASGGLVFGGQETSTPENHQVDGTASGGIVFGGSVAEEWSTTPNNYVAVKNGTYRISGTLYTLAVTMSYTGLGDIAALVDCGDAPATVGYYRYDLLSVDAAGTITVTAGTEAATPVMPSTPTNEVKLDHVLRYYGQTQIIQGDIGKMYVAPTLTQVLPVATDDELAWAESSTVITVTFKDQYGALYTGTKTVTASFLVGNGSVSPTSQSGAGSSFTFTYTRGGTSGDISPVIQFASTAGPLGIVSVTLLNVSGNRMF